MDQYTIQQGLELYMSKRLKIATQIMAAMVRDCRMDYEAAAKGALHAADILIEKEKAK